MIDTAAAISQHLHGISISAVEQVFATALRYRLNDETLRGEFSGILDRYTGAIESQNQNEKQILLDNNDVKITRIVDYFNPVFEAGQDSYRSIRIRNQSSTTLISEGANPFFLSYWLKSSDGTLIEGVRSRFPIPVHPGRELTVPLRISVPSDPGKYHIDVKMVQEFIRWEENCLLSEEIDVIENASVRSNLVCPPHNGYFDFNEDIAQSGQVFRRAVKLGRDRADDEQGDVRVLEVACGHDPISMQFYQPNTRVVACDLSFPQVQLGALMHEKTNAAAFENSVFASADIFDLPFRAESFDVVVISAALHHFSNTVEALRIMARLIRPTGSIVILREPAKYCPDDPTYIKELMNGFNEQQFVLPEYDIMFERSGLEIAYEQLDFESSYKAILQRKDRES